MVKWLVFLTTFAVGTAIPQDASPTSRAAQFTPEPGQSFYLELDTPKGDYSQWRQDDITSVSALRAVVRVLDLRKDRKWNPAFSIWLMKREAGTITNEVGVQLVAPHGKRPLVIRLAEYEGKKPVQNEISVATVRLDQDLDVELAWGNPHTVTIRLGATEIHDLNIGWTPNSVEIAASSGEMRVDPLVLGNSHRNQVASSRSEIQTPIQSH